MSNLNKDNVVDLFLNPRSVAVIGASKNPIKGGFRIVNNLVINNFNGKVFPINPNARGSVAGLKFKKSVLEIEEEVDLAIFYVPNRVIPGVLKECVEKGIKGAIIEASGFEEVGEEGLKLRDEIIKITENFTKMRIVGPNCMGLTRIDKSSNEGDKGGFFSSFGLFSEYKRGNIAIISQSGMLNGGYLVFLFSKYPDLGIRYSCSIGNKMDLSEIEFLEYFLEDPTVNVITIYLESFKDPRKFINLARKTRSLPNKTLILLKGGITSQGQKAALSHTAALSENSKLIEAIIKQAGVIQARSFHELFQLARTFSMIYNSNKTLPKNGNVSMITGTGGGGTVTADLAKQYGLNFPKMSDATYSELVSVFPEWMPPNRFALVDLWPAMEKAAMNNIPPPKISGKVFNALMNDDAIQGLFNMLFCSSKFKWMVDVDLMLQHVTNTKKPTFFWLIGENDEVMRLTRLFNENNIPAFTDLHEMVRMYKALVEEAKNKSMNEHAN